MKYLLIIFSIITLAAVGYVTDSFAILGCDSPHCYALETFRQYQIHGIEYDLQAPDLFVDRSTCLQDIAVSTGWLTSIGTGEWGEAGVTKGSLRTFNADRECVSLLSTYYAYNAYDDGENKFIYTEILVPNGRVDSGDNVDVKIEKHGDNQIRFFINTPDRTDEFASARITLNDRNVYYADFGIEGTVSGTDEYSSIPISSFTNIKIKKTDDSWINLPASGAPVVKVANEGYKIVECTNNSFVAGVVTSLNAADCNHTAVRNQVPSLENTIINVNTKSPRTITLNGIDTDKDYLEFKLVQHPTGGTLDHTNKASPISTSDGHTAQLIYTPRNTPPTSDSFRVSVSDERVGHTREALITIIGPAPADSAPSPIDDLRIRISGSTGTLQWSHPQDGGSEITSYRIERSADSLNWSLVDTVSETATSKTVTVYPGLERYYRIFVNNDIGKSAESNILHVDIADNTPPTVTISSPVAGSTVTTHVFSVDASAREPQNTGLENPRIRIDGITASDPISFRLLSDAFATIQSTITSVANGEHTLEVSVENGDGLRGSSSISFVTNAPVPQTITFLDDDFTTNLDNWILTADRASSPWEIKSPRVIVPDSAQANKIVGANNCDNICTMELLHTVDTTSMTEPKLDFYRYIATSIDNDEGLIVYLSTDDGENYTEIANFIVDTTDGNADYDDGMWHKESYPLTSTSQLKLKFEAYTSSSSERVELDDIRIFDGYVTLDVISPVIVINPPNLITLTQGDIYSELGASCTDNIDGNISNVAIVSNVDTTLPGTYQVTYDCQDIAGNDAVQVIRTVNVVIPQVPPVLSSISDVTINEGDTKTFAASATDDNNDTITYSLSNSPAWVTISGVTITISAPSELSDTSYSGTVVATDNDGTDTDTFTINITEVNQIPSLGLIDDINSEANQLISFTITASDSDLPVQTLSYSMTGTPAGAVMDDTTGAFSWSPTESQVGIHTITFTVTDNGSPIHSDSENVTFTITEIPDTTPPTITVPADKVIEATAINTILTESQIGTATATDDRGNNSIITNDRPDSFPLGDTTITYTATDGSNNVSTKSQVITITDTTPPLITSPADITQDEGITVTLGVPITSDIFPVTITNNATDSFPVGFTTIRHTATDSNGNSAFADQRVVIEEIQPTQLFHDTFDSSLNGWEKYSFIGGAVKEISTFDNYTLSIDNATGNPLPSAAISGDGLPAKAGMQKTVDISSVSNSPLYLSFDYRAKSDIAALIATNANLGIYDGVTGKEIHYEQLIIREVSDSGWQRFNADISGMVSGHDTITIRLFLTDSWSGNVNQQNWYDNVTLGTQQLPTGQSTSLIDDGNNSNNNSNNNSTMNTIDSSSTVPISATIHTQSSTVNNELFTFSGTSSEADEIALYRDGMYTGDYTTPDDSGNWSFDVMLNEGENTLGVVAYNYNNIMFSPDDVIVTLVLAQ